MREKSIFNKLFLIVLFFLTGLLSNQVLGSNQPDYGKTSTRVIETRCKEYVFMGTLLAYEIGKERVIHKEFNTAKNKIEELIAEKKRTKLVDHVSVYFHDLITHDSFVISEKEDFAPASLLKVPVMIAFLKQAEIDSNLLSRRIKYNGGYDYNIQQNIKPSKSIEVGKSYTIDELIYRSIVYSDNNANIILLKNIDSKILSKAYTDLGLEVPSEHKTANFMSVASFSQFFHILFDASYLNKEMSKKALDYLAQSEFKDGLVAGVPSSITVAHKFGERSLGDNDEIKQLHDCGIIYYPDNPYLLCVMTRGSSFEYLDDTIREVSFLVYWEFYSMYRK